MPVRLIIVLLLVVFEGAFIGFNLENVCNVWLFKVFEAVPVYITVLVSFAAGVLVSILFFAFGRIRRSGRERDAHEGQASRARKKRKNSPPPQPEKPSAPQSEESHAAYSAHFDNSSNKPETGDADNPKI